MSSPIEDYGIIGNARTAALVARNGSIDWLCLPRFDSESCFGALLGEPKHGRWLIEPEGEIKNISRRYRGDTGILETTFETADGSVTIVDFMPLADNEHQVDLIRLVRGDKGRVRMRVEIILRFDYGRGIPWVRQHQGGPSAVAGPNAVQFISPVELHGTPEMTTLGDFTVEAGEAIPFTMSWYPSHHKAYRHGDPHEALLATENQWKDWASHCSLQGPWRDAIIRSLITLKMLTFYPTGGILAAATTSLPEWVGGVRNWDYRFCWIRDATLSLYALLSSGYRSEARAWREWLLRAAAGHPSEMQIMYGLSGERRLTELEIPWLPGYAGSAPVRIGNAAHEQLQLDVYGELMDALYACHRYGLEASTVAWDLQLKLLEYLEEIWECPDQGMWEVRGEPRHFTFSKVMVWVAFDRGIKSIEQYGMTGPLDHWRELRARIKAQILDLAYDGKRNSFVQYYGADDLDASLLLIPQLGFLPPDDPRILGTIAAIERELVSNGFVCRYPSRTDTDGLPAGEGVFLACSFWLANSLARVGRRDDAVALFERLLTVRNDLGLLAEEYDPIGKRMLGNFPQAFSHTAIINTAAHLAEIETSSAARGK
ncbi:MAG TPA: glycoside hydrolase family 15 protein [Stellaceae bacterium]|jgi:GH15 family glucan-1,4-alpha-glucosidase|nr:glycoside hydrolase family 15 protein [Stellaceae bacterium]